MRVAHAIKYDMLFQYRHGFHHAYLIVTVIYVLALLNLSANVRQTVTTVLLLTESAALGSFFIGAMLLLEREQNTLESLFVTPLRISEYFAARVVSLTLLALASALAIVLLTHGPFEHVVLFITGLALSSCFYTLFGFIFAVRAKNVNDYFAKAIGAGLLICLPVLGYLQVVDTPLFYLFPTQATLMLLDIVFRDFSTLELIYAYGCLLIWTAAAGWFAYREFYRHITFKIGSSA